MNSSAIKAIHIQVPVGIPTADGGLEIPNRVFLGGVPSETTEMELEMFFADFGEVKDVRIVTDRITGECKGYGFVTFDENEDISGLVKRKSITMKGKKVRVRKAIRRNGSQFAPNNSDAGSQASSARSGRSGSFASTISTSTENSYYLVPADQGFQPPQMPSPCYMQQLSPPLQQHSPTCSSSNGPPSPALPVCPHASAQMQPQAPTCGPIYYFNPPNMPTAANYGPYAPMAPQWPMFQQV